MLKINLIIILKRKIKIFFSQSVLLIFILLDPFNKKREEALVCRRPSQGLRVMTML